jgi:pyruvate ferredoxin oxidoreductase alpha subunit
VDEARKAGKKAGFLKIRSFRPIPRDEIIAALKGVKAAAVLDRADGLNAVCGPLLMDVRSVLYGNSCVPVVNYIYGLGGRDILASDLNRVIDDLLDIAGTKQVRRELTYLGVRE